MKCVFLEGENMSLSEPYEASLKRYQNEIDRGKNKVAALEVKIAQEKKAIVAKTLSTTANSTRKVFSSQLCKACSETSIFVATTFLLVRKKLPMRTLRLHAQKRHSTGFVQKRNEPDGSMPWRPT